MKYVSNPILITKHDQAQLYFGVIHGHTGRSDGVGTVEDGVGHVGGLGAGGPGTLDHGLEHLGSGNDGYGSAMGL